LILARLKSETARLHARAEELMPTLDELVVADHYAACVRSMHGFHAAWEPAIWATPGVADVIAEARERRKLPLLAADLAALRLTPALPARFDAELTCATALGALYVLEGASLGGQVIARHLRSNVRGDTPSMRYFTSYGERTGAMWKSFGSALSGWSVTAALDDAVVAGAIDCFEALVTWFHAVPPRALRLATRSA
jgi:heme oxygenase